MDKDILKDIPSIFYDYPFDYLPQKYKDKIDLAIEELLLDYDKININDLISLDELSFYKYHSIELNKTFYCVNYDISFWGNIARLKKIEKELDIYKNKVKEVTLSNKLLKKKLKKKYYRINQLEKLI